MLALSLEKLSQTYGVEKLDVRIFLDICTDERADEVDWVRDKFLPTADIFRAQEHISVLSGCWNICQSLKAGWETGASLIFFVEEDVMVRSNFFDWHRKTHESNDYFVTCGRRHGGLPLDFYSNPGTCYKRDKLALVIPHINEEFFSDPGKYLKKHFPSMDGLDGPLDDGLIRKVIRSVNGKVLCAEPNVAVHQGFHYYNRIDPYMNWGKTIQEKIERLREILSKVNPRDRYAADFESF